MRKLKSISIIGLGAIGAAYASKLYDMDPGCISIIADRERAVRYSEKGFIVNDKSYDFRYMLPEESCPPADLILIAVKYHNLQQAIKDIRSHVGDDTIIISLLNGISSEEIVGKEYGMEKLLYSTCVGIDGVREGNDIRFSSFGQLHFGEKSNKSYSQKVEAVRELFDRSDIPYVIPEDMIRTLWWKFMVNVGINQTSAVLRAPYWVFQQVDEAYKVMESAMREVINLSIKAGVNLDDNDIKKFDKVLKTLSPQGKTSMLQDVEASRKTEVEMLAGTVCELGHKYETKTPVNEMLLKMIKIMENMSTI